LACVTQKNEENKKLNESLESTLHRLDESRQLLKTNENVINWLNKQVTETQLATQSTQHRTIGLDPSAPSYSQTTSASVSGQRHPFNNSTNFGSIPVPPYRSPREPLSQGSGRQAQVQYQMPFSKPSMVPVPINKSTPVPRGIVPTPMPRGNIAGNGSGGAVSGEAKGDPQSSPNLTNSYRDDFLDPKYLQKTQDIPLRPILKDYSAATGLPPAALQSAVRINKEYVVSGTTAGVTSPAASSSLSQNAHEQTNPQVKLNPSHPPLTSSYFPSKVS
jgi:hypothetical protein